MSVFHALDRPAAMSPKKRAHGPEDKAARHEREQRVAAAQARREAGMAKAKIGDALPVQTDAVEEDEKQPTVFDMLVRHKYVGIPLRMVQARLEKKRQREEAAAAREAKRVWDMMMLLEPGMRVKLVHVGRIGGVKYDGKLATVIADVGNRYAVRLDSVDPDGTVHEGQGVEIKISAHNMEIYDREVEEALAEQEALDKIRRKEERAELLRDIRQVPLACVGKGCQQMCYCKQQGSNRKPQPQGCYLGFKKGYYNPTDTT